MLRDSPLRETRGLSAAGAICHYKALQTVKRRGECQPGTLFCTSLTHKERMYNHAAAADIVSVPQCFKCLSVARIQCAQLSSFICQRRPRSQLMTVREYCRYQLAAYYNLCSHLGSDTHLETISPNGVYAAGTGMWCRRQPLPTKEEEYYITHI